MMLNPDKSVLCFDGEIGDLDASYVAGLEENGVFIVRSLDGFGATALAIANVLLQRRATVVIYDYCLSVCATYFFFASVRTYVLKGSLVAWQAGSRLPDCPTWLRPVPDENGSMVRSPCDALGGGLDGGYGKYVLARQQFYSQRSNAAKSAFPPTTPNIARTLWNMYRDTGVSPIVAWTMNPIYLYSFKTKIQYEAYPASQHEVDEMAARLQVPLRLGVRKVIYDP